MYSDKSKTLSPPLCSHHLCTCLVSLLRAACRSCSSLHSQSLSHVICLLNECQVNEFDTKFFRLGSECQVDTETGSSKKQGILGREDQEMCIGLRGSDYGCTTIGSELLVDLLFSLFLHHKGL